MNQKSTNDKSTNEKAMSQHVPTAAASVPSGRISVDASTVLRLRPIARHISLDDARSLVERDDRGKWDVTVPRREMTLRNGRLEFSHGIGRFGGSEGTLAVERMSISPYALGQICARLGIPVTYLRQCPLILQDQNVNFWLRQGGLQREVLDETEFASQGRKGKARPRPEDERWLLRARHGTLRAALSQHYTPLDNAVLLETLAPVLPPHYQVQWLGLEDESFHLRVIDPSQPRTVLPGDDFFVGIHISNSEVGARSLAVDALVYRLVCSNGLIGLVKGKSLLRQRHIHVAAPRFKAALEEALSQALSATEELLFQLQSAASQKVPEPDTAIERLSRLWHLSESTEEAAKAALRGEPGNVQESAYGLLNAFTAAQMLSDEKRYDLEVLAGGLAQHGVPKFALSPKEAMPETARRTGSDDVDGMVDYARELFGGRVMRRQRASRERELVGAGTGGKA